LSDPNESDTYLVEHVREHLIHDPRIRELDIHVTMHGTTLVVTGNVATEERRNAISEALDALLPAHTVRNDTTVTDLTDTTSEEQLP
jgi:hypothetical protein